MWGSMYDYTPPCSSVIDFLDQLCLLFDIIPHSVQPSQLPSVKVILLNFLIKWLSINQVCYQMGVLALVARSWGGGGNDV